jgi:rRNA maturation endonuclease Nob1
MEKEYNFTCYSCDTSFTVISEEKPAFCPFCGLDLDEENEDEELDEELEYIDDED